VYWIQRCSYSGKLLEVLLKGAKVDGCKPNFSARLRKLLVISSLDNTYIYHIMTVNENEVSLRQYIGPRGSYFGKLLELLLKGAKVDGCKPSFSARLRKLLVISSLDNAYIYHIITVNYNEVSSRLYIGSRGRYFAKLLENNDYSKELKWMDTSHYSQQD
jgi:hypothetical protein